MIRALEEETGRPIGVLVDLQGPKLRLGVFADGGGRAAQGRRLHARRRPDARRRDARAAAASGDPGLARARPPRPDRRRQGAAACRRGATPTRAATVVEVAGRVSNRKGVSLPDTTIPTSAMTDKDRADLDAALEEDIDWIALSFVQRPEDVAEVKAIASGRALRHGQDREAAGDRAARRDHGGRRRASWWRAAISASRCRSSSVPGLQKTHDPHARRGSASPWSWRRRCWNR